MTSECVVYKAFYPPSVDFTFEVSSFYNDCRTFCTVEAVNKVYNLCTFVLSFFRVSKSENLIFNLNVHSSFLGVLPVF